MNDDDIYIAPTCIPMTLWGDACFTPVRCNFKRGLTCNTGTGKCICTKAEFVWEPTLLFCFEGYEYGNPCPCKPGPGWNLQCDTASQLCICKPGLVPDGGGGCTQPGKHGDPCDSTRTCESGPTWNLECRAKKCECVTGTIVQPGRSCAVARFLGEDCSQFICHPTGRLNCDPSTSRCVCQSGNYQLPPANTICAPPALHGQVSLRHSPDRSLCLIL